MRRWFVLCSVLFAAAACGGGGGSAPSSPQYTPVFVTPLAGNTTLQRSLVQQSLTSASQAPTIAGYITPASASSASLAVTLGAVRRALSTRRATQATTTTPCTGGQTSSLTSTGGSTFDFTQSEYYDAACTKLWWVGTYAGTETATQQSLTGSIVYYTQAGVVYEYANPATIVWTVIGSSTTLSIGSTIAVNQTSPPLGSIGLGCSIGLTAASCSLGAVAHVAALSADDGSSASATASVVSTNAGTTVTISGSGSNYTGALNALSLAPQGTYGWSVLGATPGVSVAVSGSVSTATGGALTALALTVTDSADAAAVTISYNSSSGLIDGTLAPAGGGTSVASFAVSSTGTGTVTYANGATAQVVNWVVQA